MGYYTDFELEIHEGESDVDTNVLADELSEISTYDWDDGLVLGGAKWYSFREDMNKISQMYPNVVFKLSGNGEESGDQWVCYFKDGKSQMCVAKISFDPYEERKLS